MSTPKKGDIIVNPKTSRPVKVGSRTWLKLVKEGLVSGHYEDDKKLDQIDEENFNLQIEKHNKQLPIGKQAVRGRGKYKGHITTRDVPPSVKDLTQYTTKKACKVVRENYDDLQDKNMEDLEAELERLIMAEMAELNDYNDRQPIRHRGNGLKKKGERYTLKEPEPEEFDDYDDIEEDDYDDIEEDDYIIDPNYRDSEGSDYGY
jgi:predicted nucleic acid-binding OB-fold protein